MNLGINKENQSKHGSGVKQAPSMALGESRSALLKVSLLLLLALLHPVRLRDNAVDDSLVPTLPINKKWLTLSYFHFLFAGRVVRA